MKEELLLVLNTRNFVKIRRRRKKYDDLSCEIPSVFVSAECRMQNNKTESGVYYYNDDVKWIRMNVFLCKYAYFKYFGRFYFSKKFK